MGQTLNIYQVKENLLEYEPNLSNYHTDPSLSTPEQITWRHNELPKCLVECRYQLETETDYDNLLRMFTLRYYSELLVAAKFIKRHLDLEKEGKYCLSIYYQKVIANLSNFKEIPEQDGAYFLSQVLKGFQILTENFGAFYVNEEMFHITEDRKAKVWISENIGENTPLVVSALTEESLMIRQILTIVSRNMYFEAEQNPKSALKDRAIKNLFPKAIFEEMTSLDALKTSEAIELLGELLKQANVQKGQEMTCLINLSHSQLLRLIEISKAQPIPSACVEQQSVPNGFNRSFHELTKFSRENFHVVEYPGGPQDRQHKVRRSKSNKNKKSGISLVKNNTDSRCASQGSRISNANFHSPNNRSVLVINQQRPSSSLNKIPINHFKNPTGGYKLTQNRKTSSHQSLQKKQLVLGGRPPINNSVIIQTPKHSKQNRLLVKQSPKREIRYNGCLKLQQNFGDQPFRIIDQNLQTTNSDHCHFSKPIFPQNTNQSGLVNYGVSSSPTKVQYYRPTQNTTTNSSISQVQISTHACFPPEGTHFNRSRKSSFVDSVVEAQPKIVVHGPHSRNERNSSTKSSSSYQWNTRDLTRQANQMSSPQSSTNNPISGIRNQDDKPKHQDHEHLFTDPQLLRYLSNKRYETYEMLKRQKKTSEQILKNQSIKQQEVHPQQQGKNVKEQQSLVIQGHKPTLEKRNFLEELKMSESLSVLAIQSSSQNNSVHKDHKDNFNKQISSLPFDNQKSRSPSKLKLEDFMVINEVEEGNSTDGRNDSYNPSFIPVSTDKSIRKQKMVPSPLSINSSPLKLIPSPLKLNQNSNSHSKPTRVFGVNDMNLNSVSNRNRGHEESMVIEYKKFYDDKNDTYRSTEPIYQPRYNVSHSPDSFKRIPVQKVQQGSPVKLEYSPEKIHEMQRPKIDPLLLRDLQKVRNSRFGEQLRL